ncbi:MAG: disulfide bond formation protein B [Sneathiella sp.]|uniref:disulfide bond formation protein B n=1 Tax=Sneathiella sp. TaxID=1964365 RepID=UPI0030035862
MTNSSETYLFRNLNALGTLAVSAVLITALYDQFASGDLPCPLCLLQRVGFVAVMSGLVLNIVKGPKADHYSIMIIAAFFGAAVSLRQVSLHVIPGTSTYGDPFLGLHYYTWAFIVFSMIILGTAIIAAYSTQYHKQRYIAFSDQTALCKIALVIAFSIVAVCAIAAFAECGPGVCPEDPKNYWLLKN